MMFETQRLLLRNWRDEDRAAFHRLNSDERIMRFFPFRRTRAEADAVMDRVRTEMERNGIGFGAAELKATGETIGFLGLNRVADLSPALDGSVEIGWRLLPEHWGQGYVTEAARAWVAHGFDTVGADEIVAFAVRENAPSIAVMKRLGMVADPSRDFDHPRVPNEHAALRPHVVYSLKPDAINRSGA
ncbi:GNAT family N-acetyltransferase [Aliihoeflea aestuarii]|jgi:RimJ/RimL family protein N-acetyltransferase|uniref:GNAT family N-acetyltransferase n=1 Tax=Aliihoeflea aestuarii TaxID=453840 RepID=UPI002095C7A6|nr:GNAT family N-acetyltransferase [Aliihoeflea aestuarii]MCO6392284.1 GNAT family N-acetyltransferase [Aliihoeflea aestuarii]